MKQRQRKVDAPKLLSQESPYQKSQHLRQEGYTAPTPQNVELGPNESQEYMVDKKGNESRKKRRPRQSRLVRPKFANDP